MATFPKVDLVCIPTPLHRLERLSKRLGVEVWIKRDDLTGFAFGGNKGRKLEYLMADAIASNAEIVVSSGAAQSNFIRQLGAACSVFGIECHGAVMECPYDVAPPEGLPIAGLSGNVRLDELFGVHIHTYCNDTWDKLYEIAEDLARGFECQGRKVYRIPVGGSTALGAYSFLQAAHEALEQQPTGFDYVVTSSSSGSTHVGLQAGFKGKSHVIGIGTDPEPDMVHDLHQLSNLLSELLGQDYSFRPDQFDLRLDYVGSGYSVFDQVTYQTIKTLAREEGLLLDPVYTGKAMTGLIDLAQRKEISGRVLFWHTGGLPTLFAMPRQKSEPPDKGNASFLR